MAITVPIGVPLFFLAALVTGRLGEVAGFSQQGLAALALAGVLHFVWGRYCNYRATKALGTNLVAPIQQVNLIITLLLAIWLLGEQFTALKVLGIALVRLGLEHKGLGASFAGGLVAYLAATAVMALVMLWPGQLRHALAVNRESAKWFALSGFLVFLSQMFLYMAMSIAPVTVVSPINRTSIVFRLYSSRWLNPQHEVFGGNVIAGTIVSLAGAVALALSVEAVQGLLALPQPLMALLNWH